MDTEQHVRELESESLYDTIRKKWADTVTGVNVVSHEAGPSSQDQLHSPTTLKYHQLKGWALKTTKKPPRMEAHVKAYLVQKFDEGARSGQKADPLQVSREMKLVKDENGRALFKPDQWRTTQQINSFSQGYQLSNGGDKWKRIRLKTPMTNFQTKILI